MRLTFLKAVSDRGHESRGRLPTEERLMTRTIQTTSRQPLPVTVDNDQILASRWLMFGFAVVALAIAGFAGNAKAADVYLQAQSFQKDVGNGVMVDMWGFASCADNTFTGCVLDAPGPQIDIDISTDLPLNIHLKNTLSTPVSIVIPGQAGGGDPQGASGALQPGERVRSFTHEVPASGIGDYSWSALRTGTYLYQSGTQPSLQVPMGLYGALVVVDGSEAYPGITPDGDAVLLFSEIDPVQNSRVAAGTGTPTE
jgi:FtsP/CotA-like multicopper oxidase with cupredoxin domain